MAEAAETVRLRAPPRGHRCRGQPQQRGGAAARQGGHRGKGTA
ncbi:hypothetical protein SLNWT_3971 [Streptomyces albus]|uniref:Uncharacterized protein n=1 Tax=Streptomyces albus (strain ATCC 21838 / DSM 41398 / FERM P-419 / JCM 4703 / NBRC 107858) TaxID=1081613 RepID=A0A0B5F220_STRA4|nr:hypothetical protein SLNWT_3971 [Streptomyces albus]